MNPWVRPVIATVAVSRPHLLRFRGYHPVHWCSGLQPPCLRFAAAVTGRHARLGTRLLARLCRRRTTWSADCLGSRKFGRGVAAQDGCNDGGRFTVGRQHSARYAGTGVPPSRRSTWALSRLHARRRSRRPPILDRRNCLRVFNGHPEIETLRRPAPDANASRVGGCWECTTSFSSASGPALRRCASAIRAGGIGNAMARLPRKSAKNDVCGSAAWGRTVDTRARARSE